MKATLVFRVGVVLAGIALVGCKLVDQTTFAPSPEASPAAPPVVPKSDPRVALLTIGYDTPNPNYQDVLRYAVREAETRAPGVRYDVIAMLPAGGDVAAGAGQCCRGDAGHHGAGRGGEPRPTWTADGTGGPDARGPCLCPLSGSRAGPVGGGTRMKQC